LPESNPAEAVLTGSSSITSFCADGGMLSDGFDVGNATLPFKKEADPIGEPTESAA
jgi:hypothetical protein